MRISHETNNFRRYPPFHFSLCLLPNRQARTTYTNAYTNANADTLTSPII